MRVDAVYDNLAADYETLLRLVYKLRRHDMDDGPCWCSVEPNKTNGFVHESLCVQVRRATRWPS